MKVRLAIGMALSALLLSGCGAGDPTGLVATGVLNVTTGGNGDIFFPADSTRLSFADSVTVAIRNTGDAADEFTVFTLFGMSSLDYTQVPSAALVTFVEGRSPSESSTTFLPSTVVGMMLHSNFDRSLVSGAGPNARPLAQDAPSIFQSASNGSFVLEPQPTGGTFVGQGSTSRRARWATVTLVSAANGAEALLEGAVNYVLSISPSQQFFGYAGNLGLLTRPPSSGGGPPDPPGTGGTGGSGTGGSDGPPSPPA
ncbi:MAG: hypothetical protein IT204_18610 [Fimbriimonadaceae bacterium]|nr:hypothetical protein [Fimbriimonadaceae bacterium]